MTGTVIPLDVQNDDDFDEDNNVASSELFEDRTVVELLTRDPDKLIDHKKLLSNTAKQVDKFRPNNLEENSNPSSVHKLKKKLSDAVDIKDIVQCLTTDELSLIHISEPTKRTPI